MAKLTKAQLQVILTEGLSLKDPRFMLEKVGSHLVGSVVSPTFRGKRDHERQTMIWDALDTALGAESVALVGMLLAYTPDEWNLGSEEKATRPRHRKVG